MDRQTSGLLFIFGQISLLALVANILVVALVPLAMVLSLGAGIAGMLLPTFAGWLAWPAKWLLTYMLDVAALLARVPHGFVQQIEFRLWEMLIAYGLVVIFCLVLHSYKNSQIDIEVV